MFAGKKSAQIREILISESAWEEMTCLFAPSLSLHLQNTPHRSVRQNDLPEKFTKTTRVRFTVDVAITPKIGPKYIKNWKQRHQIPIFGWKHESILDEINQIDNDDLLYVNLCIYSSLNIKTMDEVSLEVRGF
ncbi:hypothetical protein [Enterobacter kobei]|uniref:hypothetical protein n=1 Tax=Enterobacter kobei TaxID=208224 RepID=UPI001F21C608